MTAPLLSSITICTLLQTHRDTGRAGQNTHLLTGGKKGRLLAVSNGFTVPALRLMHCDTLELFVGRSKAADEAERQLAAGLGLLMRTAVFAHGHACGCTKAEILAINDDGVHAPRMERSPSKPRGCQAGRFIRHVVLQMSRIAGWLPITAVWGSYTRGRSATAGFPTCRTCWSGAARGPA